ncbi:MAG: PASTA domain-containing protein, partial [Nocardioides sp.]|nr:PASTA domain-containing protein [Nocardioides sp.]
GFVDGRVDFEPSADEPADTVIRQDPNRDVYVEAGSTIGFVVSTGKPEVEVPYVMGLPKGQARDDLNARNLKVKLVETESDEPKDQVIEVSPPAGQSVAEGTTVTITWSDGPETIPDVVGMQQGKAKKLLTAASFEVEVVPTAETTEPAGTVVRQIPESRESPAGTTVTIFVSTYVAPTAPPTEAPTLPPTEVPTIPPTLPPTEPPPTG